MTARRTLKEISEGFTSYEEEANFWDTADLSEFEDEFEPVEVEVSPDLRHSFRVSFERDEAHRLWSIARRKNVSASALMKTWILEGLERAERDLSESPKSRASAD